MSVSPAVAPSPNGPARHEAPADPWHAPVERPRSRYAWTRPLALGAVTLAGTAYTAAFNPNDPSEPFPLCPLKAVVGWDCPACGCLRATHALTNGQIGAALDHNVIWVLMVPVVVLGWAAWMARSLGATVPRLRLPSWVAPAFIIGLVAFGVVRNLPIPGHDFLISG